MLGVNLLEMGESSLNIVLVVQAEAPGGAKLVKKGESTFKIVPEEKCTNMSLILLQN